MRMVGIAHQLSPIFVLCVQLFIIRDLRGFLSVDGFVLREHRWMEEPKKKKNGMAIKDIDERMRERHLKNSTAAFFMCATKLRNKMKEWKANVECTNLETATENEEIYNHKYLIIIEKFIEEREREREKELNGETKTMTTEKKQTNWERRVVAAERHKEPGKNYLYFIYFKWIPQCSYVEMCRECAPKNRNGSKIPSKLHLCKRNTKWAQRALAHTESESAKCYSLIRCHTANAIAKYLRRKKQSRNVREMLSLDTTLFCVAFEYEIIRIQADIVIISSRNSTFPSQISMSLHIPMRSVFSLSPSFGFSYGSHSRKSVLGKTKALPKKNNGITTTTFDRKIFPVQRQQLQTTIWI